MNDYETKKQARIDYYRDKADKARAESHDLYKQSSDMLSAIPPGQPLLVDHYSYKSDKRYRDRAAHKMEKSMEAMDKAAYYDQKAQAAENNTAISSDDPEAITKLKDKLDKLKNKQSLMKQVNAYYRKLFPRSGPLNWTIPWQTPIPGKPPLFPPGPCPTTMLRYAA